MKTLRFTSTFFLIAMLFMAFALQTKAAYEEGGNTDNSSAQSTSAQINNLTLGQSYPNPANEIAIIPVYNVPEVGATLIIFDVLGNSIHTQNLNAGYNEAYIYTAELATGTYFYRVIDSFKDDKAGSGAITGKMEVVH